MKTLKWQTALVVAVAFFTVLSEAAVAQTGSREDRAGAASADTWSFAASGDSRNCGDVVMPAIAAGAKQRGASFYWHLGDFRAIYKFDEDMQHQPENVAKPMVIIDYERRAWNDFLQNQIAPFGDLPVFLGIGNHETIPPKTRDQYIIQFADWLDSPVLRAQRLKDDPHSHALTTYYHWIQRGVDFINLDNATADQFDRAQMAWFKKTLRADESNPEVHTIVLGMHEALPESISKGHSMNESPTGTESGREVYADLLKAQNDAHKHVYILASHSHFYMEGIFNTEYWRANGGVLPGWIVGTAGAERYALPTGSDKARAAKTNVYGYLLGSVKPNGVIDFAFRQLNESDIPAAVTERYSQQFVHWCFAENSEGH
ncbi:MAG: hypothetical protein ACRD4S_14885 [Candidatus Acidiferrales bacterium]